MTFSPLLMKKLSSYSIFVNRSTPEYQYPNSNYLTFSFHNSQTYQSFFWFVWLLHNPYLIKLFTKGRGSKMFKNCPQGLWMAPFIQIAKIFFPPRIGPYLITSYYAMEKLWLFQTFQKNSRRDTKLITNESTSVLHN